jgi:hypothetical protein
VLTVQTARVTGLAQKRRIGDTKTRGERPADKLRRIPASRVHAGARGMADERWLLLAEAAGFIGKHGDRFIRQARRLKLIPFRGVRAAESEPVEIPFSEIGPIDCESSRIGDGMITSWRDVMMRWDDVKRLAQVDVDRLLQKTQKLPSAREGASNADILEAEDGWLVKTVALELRRHFPEGRPRGLTRDKLILWVHKKSDGNIDLFSPATLDRAIALAWPRAKRSHAPKAAKPPR